MALQREQIVSGFNFPARDLFGNLRTSDPFSVISLDQYKPYHNLLTTEGNVSGTGTSATYDRDKASTTLAVSGATAGKHVFRTRAPAPYQPKREQNPTITFNGFSAATGITKRIGYFDDRNGIFLENDEGAISFVVRSYRTGSAVDTKISRASWDDPMDGTGSSGYNWNLANNQIVAMPLEWLGVGGTALVFAEDENPILAHFISRANTVVGVYMSTASLPLRAEIENDGTGAADSDFEVVCGVVDSYGAQGPSLPIAVPPFGRASGFTVNGGNDWDPIVSVRMASEFEGIRVKLVGASVHCTSSADYDWGVFINPAINGVDNASWTTYRDTGLEYDVSRTNANDLSDNGTDTYQVIGGSVSADVDSVVSNNIPLDVFSIGTQIDGTQDELVLAVRQNGGGTETYFGFLNLAIF